MEIALTKDDNNHFEEFEKDCESLLQEEEILQIIFNNEEHFQKLGSSIRKSITDTLRAKGIRTLCKDECVHTHRCLRIYRDVREVEEGEDTDDEENNSLDNLFLIDTNPGSNVDISSIPSYNRSVKDVLNNDTKKSNENEDCLPLKAGALCFNCSGSHSLKDCPEPRNPSRISKSRKQFLGNKSERYHVDMEQRFGHLKPGQLSKNLKRALGLKHREIPRFTYKMRLLGYPPGWLEDAKVSHSGISIFDSEGCEQQVSKNDDAGLDVEKCKYDIKKIISFPGFNVDPGPDYPDEYRFHGVPPLQVRDMKELFISSLGDNIVQGYKRKKLKNTPIACDEIQSVPMPADMEIDDIAEEGDASLQPPLPPGLPEDTIAPQPPPKLEEPLPHITPKKLKEIESCNSPSLEDLEAKQKQLLEALEEPSFLLDATVQDDSLIDEVLELETRNEDVENSTISTKPTDNQNDLSLINESPTPTTPEARKISSVLGTPVLQFSPYNKLPEGDLFRKGVSDVIYFENLPDSTGKYEQMKIIINKVRTAVTQLNDEN